VDTTNHKPDSKIAQPWNKGKLTGAKPPLCPKHVWAVRTRLQLEKRLRESSGVASSKTVAVLSSLRSCKSRRLQVPATI
jgi:hypothetical protein